MACILVLQLLAWTLVLAEGRYDNSKKSGNPTEGFVEVALSGSDMKVQSPWDLSEAKRYSFKNGVHTLKVYSTDKPLSKGSPTKPRTEVRIAGHDYSSGVWQFQGQGYVPRGTSGVSIMQVFGAGGSSHATTLQLRVYEGDLAAYRNHIRSNIYDKWFKLNVIHDVGAGKVKVYFDGDLIYQTAGRGGNKFYFKFGVYGQIGDSHYMESRWKGIKIFKKK
ncbi:Citrate-binding protein [Linum grandiflorum]